MKKVLMWISLGEMILNSAIFVMALNGETSFGAALFWWLNGAMFVLFAVALWCKTRSSGVVKDIFANAPRWMRWVHWGLTAAVGMSAFISGSWGTEVTFGEGITPEHVTALSAAATYFGWASFVLFYTAIYPPRKGHRDDAM